MKILYVLASYTPVYVKPNHLSWSRILAIPFLWGVYFVHPVIAFLLYALVCMTDWLDGHLARTRGLITQNGKRLDEVSDKALALGIVILLFGDGLITFSAASPMLWCVVIITIREGIVTTLRETWPERARRIPSLVSAKWKTTLMMMGFGLLMLGNLEHEVVSYLVVLGSLFLLTSTVLAVSSGWQYIRLFAREE